MTYLTRFPASFDPSEFGSTIRYREGTARNPAPYRTGGTGSLGR